MKNEMRAVILAAGKGSRMKSDLPKVLHKLAGKALLLHVLENLHEAGIENPVVVVGHKAEMVKEEISKSFPHPVSFSLQEEQLGTGHAVKITENHFKDFDGSVMILSGDVPMLSTNTIKDFVNFSTKNDSHSLTLMSMVLEDAAHYGRIVRDEKKLLERIVEYKDASEEIRKIKEVNCGSYIVKSNELFSSLRKVNNDNAAGEYYLPDIINILREENKSMGVYVLANPAESAGINTLEELAKLEELLT